MEVVEEINRIRDDRLLETFEEHRVALLHVLKNSSAITVAVLGEDFLRRIVEHILVRETTSPQWMF